MKATSCPDVYSCSEGL
jgi:hypothetical protein